MNNKFFTRFGLVLLLIHFFSCTNSNTPSAKQSKADTIIVWADTSLAVFANEHKKAFENAGKPPVISLVYKNEAEIISALLNNKIHAAFLQRLLSPAEAAAIEKLADFNPKQYAIAYDAFVFVCSNKNSFEGIDLAELESVLKGQKSSTLNFVVENKNALSVQFLKLKFNLSNQQLSNLYSKNNTGELFQFLKSNPNSIGLIPFSYISDVESEPIAEMLEGLKVLSVICLDSNKKSLLVIPSQSSIASKEYPLINPIVFVNSNMPFKSGINFVNYLYKPRAQRLTLKLGLCPAIFPGREIKINTK
jgi:phosphate transport system substrate-binding protein